MKKWCGKEVILLQTNRIVIHLCNQICNNLLSYGDPWVLTALETWLSLPMDTCHSGGVLISMLIAVSEAGQI
jgi:hypothetical protein